MTLKKLSILIGSIVGAITITTTAIQVDKHYAKAAEVQQIEWRLDQKIIKDRVNTLQERIWMLEDRYGIDTSKMAPEIREEIRNLRSERQQLDKELHILLEQIREKNGRIQ